MKTLLFIAAFLISDTVFGQVLAVPEGERPGLIEVSVGAQTERRSGYLAKDRSGSGLAISVHLFSPVDRRSFFDIQFAGSRFEAVNTAGELPFAADKEVHVSTTAILPNLGFWSFGQDHGFFFVGVGPALVTVRQDDPVRQSQTYGTFLWQAGSRYQLTEAWSATLKLNHYEIAATVNDNDTFFASFNTRIEIGYNF